MVTLDEFTAEEVAEPHSNAVLTEIKSSNSNPHCSRGIFCRCHEYPGLWTLQIFGPTTKLAVRHDPLPNSELLLSRLAEKCAPRISPGQFFEGSLRRQSRRKSEMQVIKSRESIAEAIHRLRSANRTIGFVPTMGALHAGHMSLVRHSTEQTAATIASIFVNPTQFAPTEDLDRYPRPIADDLDQLRQAGVDLVFSPTPDEMYPPNFSTSINPPAVARQLEGEFRPEHFAGVATVVVKLFNLVRPDVAYFGQKDYQQCLVIQHVVRDLNLPTRVVMCPIVRDQHGLALSSRNRYLEASELTKALGISSALQAARTRFAADMESKGHSVANEIESLVRNKLSQSGINDVDYARVVDDQTLAPIDQFDSAVCLIAARVGSTRLIDNCLLHTKEILT